MNDSLASSDAPTKAEAARPEIVALSLVAIALGIVTRFFTRSSLWLDEALSVQIAGLPLGEIGSALKHDGHPPLFYVLLHGWMNLFGTSDIAVRALSGVFGVATLALVWILGRRKGGPTLAWVATAVVAVSPFAVRYSNETRMYALVIFLVTLGWIVLDDVVVRGKATVLRFVGLALVATALLYTHYWALWLLGAVGLTSLWKMWRASERQQRRVWLGVIAALLFALLAFLPWIPTMLYQSANTGTPWAKASRPTSALSVTLADNAAGGYGEQALVAALFAIALVLGVFGFVIDRRTTGLDLRTRTVFRGPAWIAALTFLLGCFVSLATSSAFASRYSSVIFPMIAIIAAAGCISFGGRWIRFGVVAVFCSFLAVGALWNVTYQRSQVKDLAKAVESSSKEGDIVVFCPDQLGPAGVRVLPENLTFISYPDYGDGKFVDWVDYANRNQSSNPNEFASKVLSDAGGSKSIYLIWNETYKTFEDKCEGLVNALAAVRPPEQLIAGDGSNYFEHASLFVFPAPR